MSDLEFTCTQKKARFNDGWNHPESILDATDENGNLINCCECDCDDNCCNSCNNQEDCFEETENPDKPEVPDNSRLVCIIYEKTCSCDESRGPDNVNDDTGWQKHCSTSIRIVRKYMPDNS